ncbi:hypothetical protein [Pseudothermotoga thermarum]|uniref:Uncharacterized protein n=1 Tax=Pseudothermotoga thermarum DSM 5069 TaxID=688269 RepID=F7YY97_9THEM|nr:hypothetical protein [Pseudothermotoga thermarum]AEH50918.1 hypothetical protein Theth_0834 [Pseudothermotoga thermarum DSM 5069]
MDYARYIKAIERAVNNIATKMEKTEISIDEIWIETSIPEDLIVELIQNFPVEFPPNVTLITSKKGIVWKRKET